MALVESPPSREEHNPALGEQFNTLEQQHATSEFGMWIFLTTELMLFGGLFTAYTVYRIIYTSGFAEGSRLLDVSYGGPNTAVLIISSLTVALGVRAAQLGHRRATFWYLVATAVLGVVFMAVKAAEYYKHFQDGMFPVLNWTYTGPDGNAVQLFFIAYYVMTGLHAVHLIIAIGVVIVTSILARNNAFFPPERHTPVEMVGLYWHFVDVIWTFLFPLLYLFGLNP